MIDNKFEIEAVDLVTNNDVGNSGLGFSVDDILKDRQENGEELYSENFEKVCSCQCKTKGIAIIGKDK